jgi:hypothetical protein
MFAQSKPFTEMIKKAIRVIPHSEATRTGTHLSFGTGAVTMKTISGTRAQTTKELLC